MSRVVAFNRCPFTASEADQPGAVRAARTLLSQANQPGVWHYMAGEYLKENKALVCTFKIHQPNAEAKPEAWDLRIHG